MTGNAELLDLYAGLRRAVAIEGNQVLKKTGLGSRQFIILWSLNRQGQMTIGDLVIASMTDKATVSRSLAQLIRAGLVEKSPCTRDGRVWYVRLTAKGQSLAPEMKRLYRRLADRCFHSLQPGEREQLARLFEKVLSAMGGDLPCERNPEVQL